MSVKFVPKFASAVVLAGCALALPAHAALTLTSVGVDKGFQLSLFADQFPSSSQIGPLGIATNDFGQIVIQEYATQRNYVLKDVDGQHFGDALSSTPYADYYYGAALTNSAGQLYATDNDGSAVIHRLNADGSSASVLTAADAGGHGIWTNPVTGHLVAATATSINDIDPDSGAFTAVVRNVNVDGVSVSPDGKTIYGATDGHVYGWNYSGALVYDSGNIGSPDGTGVIQGNTPLAGFVVANSNNGQVWLLDPVGNKSFLIASGGSRGDYVGLDLNDGSLLLTQSDSVYRLTCGLSCGFSAVVPEPSSCALLLAGLAAAGAAAQRRETSNDPADQQD